MQRNDLQEPYLTAESTSALLKVLRSKGARRLVKRRIASMRKRAPPSPPLLLKDLMRSLLDSAASSGPMLRHVECLLDFAKQDCESILDAELFERLMISAIPIERGIGELVVDTVAEVARKVLHWPEYHSASVAASRFAYEARRRDEYFILEKWHMPPEARLSDEELSRAGWVR